MHKFGFYPSGGEEEERHQRQRHHQLQEELRTMPVECDPEQEDDFVAGLVEQMAHSMLEEEEEDGEAEDECGLSPPCFLEQHSQSSRIWAAPAAANTLSEQRRSGWSSSNTSPSPAVSPPTPLHQHVHYESKNDAWELLHMAAQEVMRLKMGRAVPAVSAAHHYTNISSSNTCSSREELRQSSTSSSFRHGSQVEIPTAPYNNDLSAGNCRVNKSACPAAFGQQEWKQRSTARHHSCYQVAAQGSSQAVPAAYATTNRRVGASRAYQQSQQQQQVRQQIANNNRSLASLHPTVAGSPPCYRTATGATTANSLSSGAPHWSPPPPNASTSGMRAVFLRGPSSTSSGTGVFLPQATGAGSSNRDQHRKPACSTVLLPSRIVEVLNLNVDELNCQGQQQGGEASNGGDDEYLNAQLSKSYSACSPTRWHSGAEHALPTEWTY